MAGKIFVCSLGRPKGAFVLVENGRTILYNIKEAVQDRLKIMLKN